MLRISPTRVFSSRRPLGKITVCCLAACAVLHTLSTNSAAQVYQFEQDVTGDSLAILEFSSLPAGPSEVVSLSFTPAGETVFGLGPTYDGTFDASILNSFIDDDGNGGLNGAGGGAGDLIDNVSPEQSSLFPGGTQNFQIFAANTGDALSLAPVDLSQGVIIIEGEFSLVPEPSSLALGFLALAAAGCLRRRTG